MLIKLYSTHIYQVQICATISLSCKAFIISCRKEGHRTPNSNIQCRSPIPNFIYTHSVVSETRPLNYASTVCKQRLGSNFPIICMIFRILNTVVTWSSGGSGGPYYSGIRTTDGKLRGLRNKKKSIAQC